MNHETAAIICIQTIFLGLLRVIIMLHGTIQSFCLIIKPKYHILQSPEQMQLLELWKKQQSWYVIRNVAPGKKQKVNIVAVCLLRGLQGKQLGTRLESHAICTYNCFLSLLPSKDLRALGPLCLCWIQRVLAR